MKNLIVEFLGAFFLALATALVSSNPLAVGLVLLAVIYIGRTISGAYYNPTLTIAGWRDGILAPEKFIPYLAAQILGSLVALLFVQLAFKTVFIHPLASEVSPTIVLVFEVLLGFAFALTFLSLHHQREGGHIAGIAIGLTLAGLATLGGLFNPAVALSSIGLETLAGAGMAKTGLWYLVIFVLGPLVGGFLAAHACDYINEK